MMKKIVYALGLILSSISCSNNDLQEQILTTDEVQTICATIKEFEYDQFHSSRTSITIEEDGPHYAWAANDTIGIFPSVGRQVEFSMASGAGSTSATFTGGGWGLKNTSTYAAYFPLIGKYYLDRTKIPVTYENQVQTGNGTTTHLGTYDYLVAPAAEVKNGGVSFMFERLGCLIQLNLTISKPTTLTSVTLSPTTSNFTTKGYYDLTESSPSITSTQAVKSLTIELENVKTTTEDELVTIYFWTAPLDLSQENIIVKVNSDNIEIPETVIIGKNFEAGKAYSLSSIVGVDFVDLGLTSGTLWATMNLGAESDTEYGDFYAWGEVNTKNSFSEDNYAYYNSTETSSSKKWDNIGSNISGTDYDAAKHILGNKWAMPTKSQMTELINECTWTWTTKNNVNGFEIKSKINNNVIFLPAAGSSGNNDSIGEACFYWSGTMYSNGDYYGWGNLLCATTSVIKVQGGARYLGLAIRPVRK